MVISAGCDTIWAISAGKASQGRRRKDQPVGRQIFRPLDAVPTDLSPAREGDMSRT